MTGRGGLCSATEPAPSPTRWLPCAPLHPNCYLSPTEFAAKFGLTPPLQVGRVRGEPGREIDPLVLPRRDRRQIGDRLSSGRRFFRGLLNDNQLGTALNRAGCRCGPKVLIFRHAGCEGPVVFQFEMFPRFSLDFLSAKHHLSFRRDVAKLYSI